MVGKNLLNSIEVTSLALLERARAWEWVKDPPARVSVPYKGNRRGRKDL